MIIIAGGKQEKTGSAGSGNGITHFNTVRDIVANGLNGMSRGTIIRTSGYAKVNDGGAAEYICDYIYDPKEAPWAILLGETNEYEYQVKKDIESTPLKDENGEYILEADENGLPIPVVDNEGKRVHKKLYALICNEVVNYRMFGAKLDGKTDDYDALVLAHKYQNSKYTIEPMSQRRHYYVRLENHSGIIRKDNNEPIICCGNIDLSGSELLIQDCNATWFGFYLWGDNETSYLTYEPTAASKASLKRDNFVINPESKLSTLSQNALIFLKEDPYAVRDDAGYLYSEPRYELLLHTTDGVLANPITYDWHDAGGIEINTTLSNYDSHTTTTKTTNSQFSISYNVLPSSSYEFFGCDVKLNTTANKYCSVLWCKCHNARIHGFTIYPDPKQMHNTVFKNAMFYIWGCYNTEIYDINGFNAAGKMEGGSNGTSGYMVRATNCLNLHIHDLTIQGYWGATAMNCVKDVHIERVNANRIDIHNYFQNLYIDHCNLFNHAIQIGEGRGICQVTNCNFYVNNLPNDSYPNAHILEFNTTYGRIFEGRVFIQNCDMWMKDPGGNEFDVCKADFNAGAISTLGSHKFPEVIIRDCNFHSYNKNTYLVYFMVAGKRNCTTSTKPPSISVGMCSDRGNDNNGTLAWQYAGRGIDWSSSSDGITSANAGQYIRTFKTQLNSEGFTAFYDTKYFLVTKSGSLPAITDANEPSDTSGNEFALGTAMVKYVEWNEWQANKDYNVGDCCFTVESPWVPAFCWICVTAGHSNGYRPVHTSGKVIEGIDAYPQILDACFWEYVDTAEHFITKKFSSKASVNKNDVIYVDGRLYKVLEGGKLADTPPLDTAWNGTFTNGSVKLGFIGKNWSYKTWWAKNSYCVSVNNAGIPCIYKLVDQDGTTSGEKPVYSGTTARSIDGDIIWQWFSSSAQGTEWQPNTSYELGDIVHVGNNSYVCVFDGKLEMPSQIVLQNITTNMTAGGDVFAFWESGTDIPTKCNASGKWTIKIENVDFYRFRTFNKGYFGRTDNPMPSTIEISSKGIVAKDQELIFPKPDPIVTIEDAPTPATEIPHTEPNDSTTPGTSGSGGTTTPDTPVVIPADSFFSKEITYAGSATENWNGNIGFTGPSGRTKVLLKATASNGAVVSDSSYLCFIDSDWTKQVKVTNLSTGVVVEVEAGKTYNFCYWLAASDTCKITVTASASDDIEKLASSNIKIPVYK